MNILAPLAALLGIEVETITERVRNAVIINAVIVLLGLVGVIFLVVAAFLALADALSPIYAALILAAVFLVLALCVYFGMKLGEGRRKHEQAVKRRSSETGAFVTTAALTALPVLLKSPLVRTLGLPAAAIAAFLLVRGNSDKSDS
ncbi:phage holin family protein [Devosia sp. 2618]|uniref:phage holin family protein n=1 Tax=Devosia sp. 2618 TaxID=3156454 RepID=UPI0033977696